MSDVIGSTRIKLAEAAASVGKMAITVYDIAPVDIPKDYTRQGDLAMRSFLNGSIVVLQLLPF